MVRIQQEAKQFYSKKTMPFQKLATFVGVTMAAKYSEYVHKYIA